MTDYILNKVSWTVKARLEELFRMMIEYKRNIENFNLSPSLGNSWEQVDQNGQKVYKAKNLKTNLLKTYLVFKYSNGELYSYYDEIYSNHTFPGIFILVDGNFEERDSEGIIIKSATDSYFEHIDFYKPEGWDWNEDGIIDYYGLKLTNDSKNYFGNLREILTRFYSIFPLSQDATFNSLLLKEYLVFSEKLEIFRGYYTNDFTLLSEKKVQLRYGHYLSGGEIFSIYEEPVTNFNLDESKRKIFIIPFIEYLNNLINYLNNQGFVFSFTTTNNSIGYTLNDLDSIELLSETSQIGPSNHLIEFNFKDIYSDYIKINLLDLESIRITPTLTSVGIGTKINTNLLVRDFQTAKKELINFIGNNYPQVWNDFYDGNVGTIFLDILSYLHDILNNYIDRSQRESYPLTAQEKENLEDWIKFMGIQIPGITSASTIIKVSLAKLLEEGGIDIKLYKENDLTRKLQIYPNMNLINGETFTIEGPGGLTFCYFPTNNDNTIEILNDNTNPLNYIYIPLIEGSIETESFIAKGEVFETYTTKQYPVADKAFMVFKRIEATENYILLKFTDSFKFFDKATFYDGVYEYNKNGALTLYFGGSNYGVQLKAGDQVVVVYLKSNGTKGNELGKDYFREKKIPIKFLEYDLEGHLLKEIPQENGIECIITENDPGSGGAEISILPEMMPAFVGLSQATNRLVTELDYDYFLETFQSKQGGRIKAKAFLNINNTDFRNANIIFIPALIYSSEGIFKEFNTYWDEAQQKRIYPPIIQELYDEIEERKMITDRIEILSGIAQEIELKIVLETSTGLNKDEIKREIEKRIKEYFMKIGFGKFGKLSDLYYIAESVLNEKDKTFDGIINNSISISWRYNKVYNEERIPINNLLPYNLEGNSKIKASDYINIGEAEFWLLSKDQYNRVSVMFGGNLVNEDLNKITALVPVFNWSTLYKPLEKKMVHLDKIYNN